MTEGDNVEGEEHATHAERPFICPSCRAQLLSDDPCPLCGTEVVDSSEDLPLEETGDLWEPQIAHPHLVLLVVGLVMLVCSLGIGSAVLISEDYLVTLGTAVSCGVVSLAMLLPWRQRHNPGGADPVPMQVSRNEMVSTAGVSLNPSIDTYATMGWVVPFIAAMLAVVLPLLALLADGPVLAARIAAAGTGWIALGALWYRHMRREIELEGPASRGVPL